MPKSQKRSVPRIIDVHAHVFNVAYLPWVGILYRFLGRKLGFTVATLAQHVPKSRSFDLVLKADARALAAMIDVDAEPVRRLDPILVAFRAAGGRASAVRLPRSGAERRKLIAWLLDQEAEALRARGGAGRITSGHHKGRGLGQGLKWVWMLLTKSPRQIGRKLAGIYPDVGLFVHMMMDMDNHYPTSPSIKSVPRQVDRMLREVHWDNGLSFLVFAAFDPFRSQVEFQDGGPSHLEIIRDAIAKGCAGVKFYPPNGYAPDKNENETLDPDAPAPALINAANDELFVFCGSTIPIFAHSQPGELQAQEGFDTLSRPELWMPVLDRHRSLRLCFGHAGSEGWYEGGDFASSWAGQIARLCHEYDNVYCEFGAFTEVMNDATSRGNFVKRLREVKQLYPSIERKLLYGSDWSMIYMDPNHAKYLEEFARIMDEAGYDADRFFRANAVEYLNFRGYLDRNRPKLSRGFIARLESLLEPALRSSSPKTNPSTMSQPTAKSPEDCGPDYIVGG